jgi:dolichol-phosphate mannosyltransferase
MRGPPVGSQAAPPRRSRRGSRRSAPRLRGEGEAGAALHRGTDAGPEFLRLSVIVPAHDEAASVGATVSAVADALTAEQIPHEVLVVDDRSSDDTAAVVNQVSMQRPSVRCIRSHYPPGFGYAVRAGLDHYTGDAAALFMADQSDSPKDLVTYYRVLTEGYDCAFGSRFIKGGRTTGYPKLKLVLNRMVNLGISVMFRHGCNDTTNAFKAYRREVIDNIGPLLSNHFNLTVEMPLKAIARGHTYKVVPISWENRRAGESKLRLQEMGSRYMFIVLYVFFERHLSKGDYRRPEQGPSEEASPAPGARPVQLGG